MASSFQTLIKILRLEQQKGHQNKAVIGGLARFAGHWVREANSTASTPDERALIEQIGARLRAYDEKAEDQRPAEIEAIIALASGQSADAPPAHKPSESRAPSPAGDAETELDSGMDERVPEPAIDDLLGIGEPAAAPAPRPAPPRREADTA